MLNGANFGAPLGTIDGATDGLAGAASATPDGAAIGGAEELFATRLGEAFRFKSGLDGDTVADVETGALVGGTAARTPTAGVFCRAVETFASLDASVFDEFGVAPVWGSARGGS